MCVKHHNEQNVQLSNTDGGQMPMLEVLSGALLVHKHYQTVHRYCTVALAYRASPLSKPN